MVFLVFPTPLLISSELFKMSQTSQDVCRIDGDLLSSLLVWSGHPPPISYSRHTKPSKYILWFNPKILDSIWQYLNGMWVTVAPLPPIFLLHHYVLPLPAFASPIHSYHVLYIYIYPFTIILHPFLPYRIHPECLICYFSIFLLSLWFWWMLLHVFLLHFMYISSRVWNKKIWLLYVVQKG